MKQLWQAQLARIDSLSLRERVFLFISILVSCAALVDTLWLSPAQTVHKQLQVRFEKQSVELQRMRDIVKATAKPADASMGLQAELATIAAQSEQVEQAVRQLIPGAADSTPLAQALVHLLRSHAGLTLVKMTALAPEVAGPGSNTGSLPAGLTRQGVALTVAGSYADLIRYVASLEAAMPFVRWGEMNLKRDKTLPELTLKLFLLGEVAR